MDLLWEIRRLKGDPTEREDRENAIDIARLIAQLPAPDAAVLAREALATLDAAAKAGDTDRAERELLELVALVPVALRDVQPQLLRRNILQPGALYLDAAAEVRDELIARVSATPAPATLPLNRLLTCLAWVGDDAVCALLDRWRREQKTFAGLHVAPWKYAAEAGWELDDAGRRRNLFSPTAYALVPREDAAGASNEAPVRVVTPHEASCGWCGRELTTLLDLDLADPRVAGVIPMSGERIRIAMCDRCTAYAVTFTEVETRGGSRWSDANVRPKFNGRDADTWDRPPERQLVLGPRQPTPYALLASPAGNSQLGGFPTWVQDAEHPPCPRCGRLMPVVGQVDWSDVERYSEGVTYAFLCAGCGVAATSYQQT